MSSDKRRESQLSRSIFDYPLLARDFLITELLSKTQVDKLIKASAASDASVAALSEIPWTSLCPNLPREAYASLLNLNYRPRTLRLVDAVETSCEPNYLQNTAFSAKDTCKLLLELQDGRRIETCIMRYKSDSPRSTVCVSSQIGCRMGCSFCATGTMDFKGNLTTGEILEQVVIASEYERELSRDRSIPVTHKSIRNVVFMGMGEPLDNYYEVRTAVQLLTSPFVLGFAPSRVTVSTVGLNIANIRSLTTDLPKISLALSLHAPTQAMRELLVPSAKSVDLNELLSTCYDFVENQKKFSKSLHKRQVLFIEYCIIHKMNDSDVTAYELSKLLLPHVDSTTLNIIPYNPTSATPEFE